MNKVDLSRRAPAYEPDTFYQHVLDNDSRPVPDVLRLRQPLQDGPVEVPTSMYTSRAVHDQEVEKLWKRVWQMACREEEIPNVGDTYLYEIAHLRFIIVRTAPDRIQAFATHAFTAAGNWWIAPVRTGASAAPITAGLGTSTVP